MRSHPRLRLCGAPVQVQASIMDAKKKEEEELPAQAFGILAPTCFFFNPGICILLNPPVNKAQNQKKLTPDFALIGFSIRQQSNKQEVR